MATAVNIETTSNRCYKCGRWWWGEVGHLGRCPKCAQLKIDELEERIAALRRSQSSLRGALKRKKTA